MRIRRQLPAAAAVVLVSCGFAACGSSSTTTHTTSAARTSRSNQSQTQGQQQGVSYARCMRSHGVSHFPDPTASGGINTSGLNTSSPAFRSAQTACHSLMPTKTPPSTKPTAAAYARLLHWAKCMREHGVSGLADPKPNPPPGPNSSGSSQFGTLMGDGGYWIGIPASVNAHSPAFMHLASRCGESPSGHHG